MKADKEKFTRAIKSKENYSIHENKIQDKHEEIEMIKHTRKSSIFFYLFFYFLSHVYLTHLYLN